MTCAEFKELCGALALGALDDDERAACEAHLAEPSHEGCPEALDSARQTVNALPLALPPVRPRPELWESIAREVTPAAAARPRRVWPAVVGAVLLAAALILLFMERRENETRLAGARDEIAAATNLRRACQEELEGIKRESQIHSEAVALLAAPSAKLVTMRSQIGMSENRAVVIFDPWANKAAILAHGFAAQPGKDYELWVIKGDMKKAAGLLRADATGAVAAIIDPMVLEGGVDAFAVTLEPAGGGESPRGPILMVGAVG